MPEASGMRMKTKIKTPLTVVAVMATTVGLVAGTAVDPIRVSAALMGVGGAGVLFFTLRPLLRPRHSHSSLPLFPVLVVA